MPGKILIVDDEPQALNEMTEFFRRRELDVTGTSDPKAALDAVVHADSLGAVITDLKMPQVDGFRIIAAAHERRLAGRLVSVIAITGHATEEDERRAFRTGATHFFSKPLELRAVLKALKTPGAIPEDTLAKLRRARECR